jgi:sucrose-phosphate synthase
MESPGKGLYIVLLSVHGLLRAEEMELGRDSDTGGQIGYVVELARALSEDPRVARVDLITRQIFSNAVDESYSAPKEQFSKNGQIIRIPFGPKRYLKKESLWPYLDSMADGILSHFRKLSMTPDVIHGHYADGGYVGSQLARLLAVPFVFTGHSLGRVKQQRMLERGKSLESVEKSYNFRRRFEAEEVSLDTAQFVVASTQQEVDEQYKLYDHYQPKRMAVIPPGFNLDRFSPPGDSYSRPAYFSKISKFLKDPEKPIILSIARPDEKKNFSTLISAYGESSELRRLANLVLIAGNRSELSELSPSARKVMRNIMYAVDRYDLYGSVSYPKHHESSDIPDVYQIATQSRGVFVNPALNEPFGLTLIEAAASGLPIVATDDGGPRDIIEVCKNGILVDPLSKNEIETAILRILRSPDVWEQYSSSGISESLSNYTWRGHVERYLDKVISVLEKDSGDYEPIQVSAKRLSKMDRILVTGVDGILTSDQAVGADLASYLEANGSSLGLCYTTGRTTGSVLEVLESLNVPDPDILISACGTEMYYGRMLLQDRTWTRHIDYKWQPLKIKAAMQGLKELELLESSEQAEFKISYRIKDGGKISRRSVRRQLRQFGLRVNVFPSYETLIDIVPIRASLSLAIRHLLFKWGIPAEHLMVCGFSGVEKQMLTGNTLGVVVGGHRPELKKLRDRPRIFFADSEKVSGLIEGIEHYNFLGNIRIPREEEEKNQ